MELGVISFKQKFGLRRHQVQNILTDILDVRKVEAMKQLLKSTIFFLLAFMLFQCAHTRTNVDFFKPLRADLLKEDYSSAIKKIEKAKVEEEYAYKDRVLYFLDKGVVLYYSGNYEKSIQALEKADKAMEELFTKSISGAAASFLLNDNANDYFGEIYENLYVNVFKALSFIHLNKFDAAYVEIKRLNDKLRELEDKFGKYSESMNKSEKSNNQIKYEAAQFYNDALAGYLSYLIFRADNEYDNSRISFEKVKEAWETQPSIYDYGFPSNLTLKKQASGPYLNILAFTGSAPEKYAVGGKITTYDDYIGISNVDEPLTLPKIHFPGLESGYHFKFSFPEIATPKSKISEIEVYVNGAKKTNLQVLEKMGNIAAYTFEANRNMIIAKTLIRTVVKGIATAEAKKELRKGTNANFFVGALMDAAIDAGVDATENADLRCWRTLPNKCYIGEIQLDKGTYDIEIRFLDMTGNIVSRKIVPAYEVGNGLNLIDATSLK
jgi:hypothetical protein